MTTLADVAGKIDLRYGTGTTKVWYAKDSFTRDSFMGYNWLAEHGGLPTLATLEANYTLLGTVDTTEPEEIWQMMQGETWSPNGEARSLLRSLGLGHTSMYVGDIVQIGDDLFMVAGCGFTKLPSNAV